MDIFGISLQELIFVLIIALIVMGPKDMQKAGRTIGRWLNRLVQSDSWKVFQRTSSELRNLPRNLMREANMEMREAQQEIRRAIDPRPNPPASASSPRPGSAGQDSASLKTGQGLPPLKAAENSAQDEQPANKASPPAGAEEGAAGTQDPEEHV